MAVFQKKKKKGYFTLSVALVWKRDVKHRKHYTKNVAKLSYTYHHRWGR